MKKYFVNYEDIMIAPKILNSEGLERLEQRMLHPPYKLYHDIIRSKLVVETETKPENSLVFGFMWQELGD